MSSSKSTPHETDAAPSIAHGAYGTPAYSAAGAALMSFAPINAIHQHLCGLHIYAHDPSRAVRAHHFCAHFHPGGQGSASALDDEGDGKAKAKASMHQCVIYDSDQPGARLIGIEYVVPEETFVALPEDEKKYWHSHKYEVESGMLMLGTKSLVPNMVSDLAEQPAMLELQKTYGKTIHTWEYDRHPDLPIGPPHSMMAYTADDQLDHDALRARDEDMGVSTAAKREVRAGYIPVERRERAPAEGCDIWTKGRKGRWVWVEDEEGK